MAQQWMRAQDTFVAVLDDGTTAFVSKGDTLPDSHELVKRDAGSGTLFRPLDAGEGEPKAAAAPRASRAAGKAS
jgi:hypothetical protein